MDIIRPEDAFKTVNQYAGRACFRCGSEVNEWKSSCACGRVFYCGKECQEADWIAVHKPICLALRAAFELFPLPRHPILTVFPPINEELDAVLASLNTHLMVPVMKSLGPRAGKIATGLVFNISRCFKCLYISVDPNEDDLDLDGCSECGIRWCTAEDCRNGRNLHKEMGLCSRLQEIAACDVFVQRIELFPKTVTPIKSSFPARILRVETPLPLDWPSYFSSADLPPNFTEDQKSLLIGHSLSIPLTIVASLVKFGLLSKFSNAKHPRTLTIHLINAKKGYEVEYGAAVMEEIIHLLPGVRDLLVVMTGLRLDIGKLKDPPANRCKQCQRGRRTRRVEFHPTTYPDFLTSNPTSPPPDLAVAFNSGICENPSSWRPTLNILISNRTPVLFTALNTRESDMDADAIQRMAGGRIDWVWEGEKNKWQSGRQRFDLFSPERYWAESNIWMGFRGRS